MKLKLALLMFFTVAIVVTMYQNKVQPPNWGNEPKSTQRRTIEPLTVSNWKLEKGYGYIHVAGDVRNNSGKQYSYVQVDFNLYDGQGNHIGTALANTNNLEPNSTWKFMAQPLMTGTANVTSAKLKGVSGF